MVLSPWELVSLIANKTSSFALDATVDRFEGGQYVVGDSFTLRVSSEREGYLYLLHIDSRGELSLLYPQPGQPNRVTAQSSFVIPGPKEDWVFRATGPIGQARIKAVVTSRPLVLSGMLLGETDSAQQSSGGQVATRGPRVAVRQTFRWHPTQLQMIQKLLVAYQQTQQIADSEFGGIQPQSVLGPFAQDEVSFYVGPATTNSNSPQN